MKRCPECRRDYVDDSLLFCLEDGAALVQGSVPSPDEPQTAILKDASSPSEAVTRAQILATDESSGLPSGVQAAVVDETASPKGFDKRLFAIPLLLALISVGGIFGYRYLAPAKQIGSIAVMPFVNQSGDADFEYLSDGMTETLISSLSNLPDMSVRPRSSVFRFKGKETSPQAIAKELSVDAVLTGRVADRGQDISLFVELVDVSSDRVVWSQAYNRKRSDLIALQSDIARDVSGKIKTKLSGSDEARVTKTYTANPEAYQFHLKGNFHLAKYNEDGYKKAIENYEKAIAIDPSYPLPHHGIANAYDFANGFYLPPNEAEPKAKAAAQQALKLDDTLAETHYLLGRIIFWYDWDWTAAEREWRRANELDPAYPAAYPVYLAAIGRLEEAVKEQQSRRQNVPMDLSAMADSAMILLTAGRYDESIAEANRALDIDPNFGWAYECLGRTYLRKKQYAESIAAFERARQLDPNPTILGGLGNVYGAAGRKDEALKVLGEMKELSKRRHVSAFDIARVYAGLGDRDQAFEWLERAFQERSFYMTQLTYEGLGLDDIRSDPRFKDLLRRMNLPE